MYHHYFVVLRGYLKSSLCFLFNLLLTFLQIKNVLTVPSLSRILKFYISYAQQQLYVWKNFIGSFFPMNFNFICYPLNFKRTCVTRKALLFEWKVLRNSSYFFDKFVAVYRCLINLWQSIEMFTFNLVFSAVEEKQKIMLSLLTIYY